MEQVLSGCEGCLIFIDDVILFRSDYKEHNMRLEKVRLRLKERNVVLNESKCVYGVAEVGFLGHVLSKDGIKSGVDKLESILNFREPKTAEEIRSFLGLVNYVGKFIPDLATLTYQLRQLTILGQKFLWGREQQLAIAKLKTYCCLRLTCKSSLTELQMR